MLRRGIDLIGAVKILKIWEMLHLAYLASGLDLCIKE